MVVSHNRKGGSSLPHSHLPTLRFQHRRQDKWGDVTCDSLWDISMSCPVCTTLGMTKFLGNAEVFPGEVSRHNFFNSLRFGF